MATDPQHTPTIIQPSPPPQKTQKPRKPKRKDTQATPNESSSLGTTLGGGPRRQETMGDTTARTRFESISKHSNDSLLVRGNTLRSDEDSLKLKELMELCTNLQTRVLDLEKTKTTQQIKIDSLKRRVKKLEKKRSSRSHKLKRLYKVGLTVKVESSRDEEDLVSVHDDADNEIFDVDALTGDEVFAEQEVAAKDVNLTVDEVTLDQALAALKSVKPKVKGDVIKEPNVPVNAVSAPKKVSVTTTITATIPTPRKGIVITELGIPTITRSLQQPSQAEVQEKGKGKMIKPEPMKPKKKDVQIMLDEEAVKKLQAEFDEEKRLTKEKDEANIALTKEWDDIQAKIKADHELAKRLQAEEAEEQRNKPPTQAQQRKIMCTYLKNMEGKKLKDLKNKSFDSIQKMFDRSFKRVNTFVDFRTDLVEGSLKRAGEELEQESTKKQKVDEDKDTAELQSLMEGDLKTMFDPHVEDTIWRNQQDYKVLEWKLFDSRRGRIVGIKSLLNASSITATHIRVNAAQLFTTASTKVTKVNVAEGVNAASEKVSTAESATKVCSIVLLQRSAPEFCSRGLHPRLPSPSVFRCVKLHNTAYVILVCSGLNASWSNLLADHTIILAAKDACLPALTPDEVECSLKYLVWSFGLVWSFDLVRSFDRVRSFNLVRSFDLSVHASVAQGGFCLFSLKDFPFVLVINLLYFPLDVVKDALAQGVDGLGLIKNEDHQVLRNKQKLEEDASDCTRVDDDGVEFSPEGATQDGDYILARTLQSMNLLTALLFSHDSEMNIRCSSLTHSCERLILKAKQRGGLDELKHDMSTEESMAQKCKDAIVENKREIIRVNIEPNKAGSEEVADLDPDQLPTLAFDQGVIASGCSRHMTENMSYLTNYEEIDGGYVAFGGNPKGRKIIGKGNLHYLRGNLHCFHLLLGRVGKSMYCLDYRFCMLSSSLRRSWCDLCFIQVLEEVGSHSFKGSDVLTVMTKFRECPFLVTVLATLGSDASIRKRALKLMYLLINETNVKPLTKGLIYYLEVSDQDFKGDLTAKICSIVEKLSPDKLWYIDQMLKVLCEVTENDAVDVIELAINRHTSDLTTRSMCLIALLKLSSRFPSCSHAAGSLLILLLGLREINAANIYVNMLRSLVVLLKEVCAIAVPSIVIFKDDELR
ncbi:retrovirus-related pol polyprotein from transposon TNT 1-94 [Tanacetum coccineum]|uniref:Retrovirus-related pol polyprotein from transposon TNT 1-94 n=1 Tax=Tanacetum coccineum TaxID=301880 RepID=A0ABQ5DC42_9ASTR